MQLHPGMPSPELGAVSSLYELSFELQLDTDHKTGLAIEMALCWNFLLDSAQKIGNGNLFLGMDAVWTEQYELTASPPHTSTATKSEVENGKKDEQRPEVLLIITDWTSQAAERTILETGEIEETCSGQVLTNGEYFTKNLLKQASAYTSHHVIFENVSASNVQCLDKEERWSTVVKRLMDEEERAKGRVRGGFG